MMRAGWPREQEEPVSGSAAYLSGGTFRSLRPLIVAAVSNKWIDLGYSHSGFPFDVDLTY